MTLVEAVQKGKYFRRPCHPIWITLNDHEILCWLDPAKGLPGQVITISKSSLLADDWEIMTRKVENTPCNVIDIASRRPKITPIKKNPT